MKLYNNNKTNSQIKRNCISDEKPSLPERLKNVPLHQNLLFAKSGNGHAVLMRQTSIEILNFCRVLICHASPQHAQCIGSHPISCWLLGVIMKGKNHSNIDRQNEMDSCIKWMRPSSLQDLGYTKVYYTYGALCPTFPQLFHDKKNP